MPGADAFRLRPAEERDLEVLLCWRNAERIRANMYTDHLISMEEHRFWFERLGKERTACALIFEIDGIPTGVVNISRIDRRNGTCHWGFYLGVEDAPQGSGTIMGFLGLDHIFGALALRKVIGEAFAFNRSSIAFHERLGFVREGVFVEQVLKNGRYEDVVSFALFRNDWLRLKPSLEARYFGQRSAT